MLAGAFAVVLSLPNRASAMGAVVGPPDSAVGISNVRVAVASAPGRTTRWAQISVSPAASGFVWLVPVLPGALVDLASDAWLDALDAATAPVVLPPVAAEDCNVALAPQAIAPATSPSSQAPASALIALDLTTLTANLTGLGLVVPDALTEALAAAFSNGMAVIALQYAGGGLPVHTLRVVDDGPATLPFSLGAGSEAPATATAFVVASGAEQAGADPLALDPALVLWHDDGTSNYATEVGRILGNAEGAAWLTESAAPGVFFEPTTIAPGYGPSVALPAVLDAYYALANVYGDTTLDPSTCAAAADATESDTSSYAAACPPGAVAVVPGMSPCAPVASDGASPLPLVCGPSAIDGALAVARLTPSSLWVTRIVGTITPAGASDVPLLPAGTTPKSPFANAGGYASPCDADGSAPSESVDVPPFDGDGGGYDDDAGTYGDDGGAVNGSGGASGDDGSGAVSVGQLVTAAQDPASSGDDDSGSCDGDSSSSGDDGSNGCSGSTSSNDDSEGCSSHSDTSDDAGDGCANGTGSSSDCSTSRHGRRGKSPVSRGVMVGAVALGIARRFRRRR